MSHCNASFGPQENTVIHRDLAARNILVHNHLEKVKLADFGIDRTLNGSKCVVGRAS